MSTTNYINDFLTEREQINEIHGQELSLDKLELWTVGCPKLSASPK